MQIATELVTGHLLHNGNCWQLSTPNPALAHEVDVQLQKEGLNLQGGPCHGHGSLIQKFYKDGVTVKEFGHGESLEMPFTLPESTEFAIFGHVFRDGHCWQVRAESKQVAEKINAASKAHGVDLHHGKCPDHNGHPIHKWSKDGVTVKEFGSGESLEMPFTLPEATEFDMFGHVNRGGHCWQVRADNKQIAEKVNDACKAHGVDLHHGKCPDHNGHPIHQWHKNGVDVKEFGSGENQELPFTLPEATEFAMFGHVNRDGHCWQLKANNKQIAEKVNEACRAHGIDLHHGKCPDHNGHPIHKWSKDGVQIKEFGSGESLEMPFTLPEATELDIFGHVNRGGHCWQVRADNKKIAEKVNDACRAHGVDLMHGRCPDHNGHPIHQWTKDGVNVKEFGSGVSQELPFTFPEDTELFEFGHVNRGGHCWQVRADNKQVANKVYDACKAHGVDLKHGRCPDHNGHPIHQWSKDGVNVKEFGSGESQELPFTLPDTTELIRPVMSATKDGKCMQLLGNKVGADPAWSKMMATQARDHGFKLHNGEKCKSMGYTDRVWHSRQQGVWMSVWTK